MLTLNKAQLPLKTTLKSLLPLASLHNLIPPFENLLGLQERVSIGDVSGLVYYGTAHADSHQTVSAPIRLSDDTEIGYVSIHAYPADDQHQLSHAAAYLAATLAEVANEVGLRRDLSNEVLERYDELNLIYDLAFLISSQELSQYEIVNVVLERANRVIKAGSGVIYLFASEQGELIPLAHFGRDDDPEFWMGRTREFALSTLYAYEDTQLSESGNVVCAPLRHGDERLGALVLMHDEAGRQFTSNDISLLTALTQNTASFIQAARLYDSLVQRRLELERTLEELKSARDELSRAERLSIIGQTVGGLVHDMRNPLNIVMGYAGMLQEGGLSEAESQEYAGQIIQYVSVFSAMAQEILDYTRSDEHIQPKPMLLDTYLDTIANLLNPPGLRRAVRVVVDASQVKGFKVRIDAQRFARVFQNLVNNAVDAIEEYGGSQVVVNAVPTADGMIRFSVTDNGPGIPDEIADQIFEPFVSGKPHGTGLGLPIVSRMITSHGGTIHYEPAPGGGACFVFTVPQA
jgi:signal transduction histidine kinase